ncbi:DUF1819 family protein [Pseudoclavibacter alba]|nr:DUF1819 family protein [Pseudoclavibacter alba]
MSSSSVAASRYGLSFTSGGLLDGEALVMAPLYLEHHDWEIVRRLTVEGDLLQTRAHSTGVTLARETAKRLSTLTDHEIAQLSDLTGTERGHMMWAAACRCHEFIGDFAEEVLRERFLTLAGTVTHEDYDSFYRAKAVWHEELSEVAESTYKKLRQMVFKMMVEACLVAKAGSIEPALFSKRVAEMLSARTPSDFRFFPTREA